MASLRKIGKTHYVRYRLDGKDKLEKLGSNITEEVAYKLLQRVEARLAFIKQDKKDIEAVIKKA